MKLLVAAVICATLCSGSVSAEPSVGVYYYPWYRNDNRFDKTLRDHLLPTQSPAIGRYDSRDATVISEHIDQSRRGNVDFWALSWWGPSSDTDNTIRNNLLPHTRAGELEYAIHYESAGRFGSFENPDFSNMLPDFRYLAQNYFDNPNYLHVDGKPVVFLYVTRAYFNTQQSRDAVAAVRQAIHNEFGQDMYLVGDDFFTTGITPQRAQLWDAVTNFDVYGTVLAAHGATDVALDKLADYYDDAKTDARELGVDFIPTASPGFNDRAVRAGHVARPRYMEDATEQIEGSLFHKMLTEVVVPRIDPEADSILMINSFNEWYEDTQIEPSNTAAPTSADDSGTQHYTEGYSYAGYGNLYLDILRQTTATPGDANLDGRVDHQDATILAANWQTAASATWAEGDFNDDGRVDDRDATILAANWQTGVTAVKSIPEPSTLVACLAVLLLPRGFRRRF